MVYFILTRQGGVTHAAPGPADHSTQGAWTGLKDLTKL